MKCFLLFLMLFAYNSVEVFSQNCISFLADIRNNDTLNWIPIDSICYEVYSNGFSNASDFGIFALRHKKEQLAQKMILKCAEKGVSRKRFTSLFKDISIPDLFADKALLAKYDSVFNICTIEIKKNKEFILLENLYNIDQFVRTEYKKILERDAFFSLLKKTDSLNYVILKNAFLNNPSLYNESLIGVDGSYFLYLLLFHNLRHVSKDEFATVEKILLEMTFNGHFSANYYALIMDERLKAQGSSDFPLYNFHNIKTNANETEFINENRKALGLKFLNNQ